MKYLERAVGAMLLAIMGLIVVHAPLTVGLGTLWPDWALVMKGWKELLMVVATMGLTVMVARSGRGRELLRDRVVVVAVGFTMLHLASLVQWPGWVQALAGLAIDLRYVVYFLLVYVFVRLVPAYGRKLLYAAGIGAAIVVGFAVVQLFLSPDFLKHIGYNADTIAPSQMVDQNPDFVRSQSTLRGPNPFAAYMVIVLAGVAAYAMRGGRHRRLALAGVAVSAGLLYLGYSRGALIGGAVVVGLLVYMKYRAWFTVKRLALVGAGVVVVGATFAMVLRTDFGSTVFLHADPNEAGRVNSDDQRINSLVAGGVRVLAEPFGAGIGSTGSASLLGSEPMIVENHYLFVAHEVGWLGLILFGMLYVMVLARLWSERQFWWASAVFASGVGLGIIGLFLPVWADDTVAIVWWGLAGIIMAGGVYGGQSAKQKTARTT